MNNQKLMEDLMCDLEEVLGKHINQGSLTNGDYMFVLANVYTAFVENQKLLCTSKDEVETLKSNAVDLIGNMIYNSALDEEVS